MVVENQVHLKTKVHLANMVKSSLIFEPHVQKNLPNAIFTGKTPPDSVQTTVTI